MTDTELAQVEEWASLGVGAECFKAIPKLTDEIRRLRDEVAVKEESAVALAECGKQIAAERDRLRGALVEILEHALDRNEWWSSSIARATLHPSTAGSDLLARLERAERDLAAK